MPSFRRARGRACAFLGLVTKRSPHAALRWRVVARYDTNLGPL